ncbi:hypothetical protein [Halovivax sp.]|uniref:hypothetical protein n=1 Tax=Halovivax sp. TaxID=1935978 RepID=UPI0025BA469B|nr:hypothetical protein [Halovivax sp.]
MTDGPAVDVLPRLSTGDVVRCFFDRYNQGYPNKPDSPLEAEVLDVETKELTEEADLLPGTLTTVHLSVPEDDDKADRFWIEHREEHEDDRTVRSVSALLYEDATFPAMTTTGEVGNVDKVEVLSSDES